MTEPLPPAEKKKTPKAKVAKTSAALEASPQEEMQQDTPRPEEIAGQMPSPDLGLMRDMVALNPSVRAALSARGYQSLTPVQEAVIAPELIGKDLLVSAQTGSGKTVAFGLALAPTILGEAERFSDTETPLVLVIAPTRELAIQVEKELAWLYEKAGARLATCVGGMDMRDERRALSRGAHIVVGTPGRLCDHIKRGSLDMSALAAIVLDEADEMLKMGFREELELILGSAPEERRTLMFSATVPKTILGLTRQYQKDAVRVNTAAEASQHVDIEYRVLTVANSDKENAIINVLRYYDAKNAIVFGDTRAAVNRMTARFNNRGFSVVALSGELSQNERSAALQALRDGRAKVCIATDVAARGLDLPDLELVIHADIPKNSAALLHRSGRTGRAGRKGISALIVPHSSRRRADRLLADAKITAQWASPPSAEEVTARDYDRLLGDDMLCKPVLDSEAEIVAKLLEAHSPEHIAAAFARQYLTTRSAPEELIDAGSYEPKFSPSKDRGESLERPDRSERAPREPRAARNDFTGGVWFSLNLGRKQKAEPRWILPMLCKSGDLKKAHIGAIKIAETKTFIEIAPEAVSGFIAAIGPDGKIEKAITASRIDGAPDFASADAKAADYAQDRPKRETAYREKPAKSEARGDKKPFFEKKPYAAFDGQRAEKPGFDKRPGEKKAAAKKGWSPDGGALPAEHVGTPAQKAPQKALSKKDEARAAARTGNDGQFNVDSFDPYAIDKPRGKKPASADQDAPKPKKPHKKKLARAAAREAQGSADDKPFAARASGKPADNAQGKFLGKSSGKSFGKPAGKPSGKPSGKPFGKPGAKFTRKPKP